MATRYRESYHFDGGLEQAVVDLVRVGSEGFASGVRQLAARLVRTVPPGVDDVAAFRASLRDAIADATAPVGLRLAAGELPTEEGTSHPLVRVDPVPSGDGLTLAPAVMTQLEEVVQERRRADELLRAGVGLTRTLLLAGPPGVGKTLTARWLAERIGVPLVTVDVASVVSSFLGSSGRNIRAALEYGASGTCVLLLDEFDALAKKRDDDTDIGELKRIVNVILVELDRWSDTSLLVAATNHAALLDPAVGRRFDRRLDLGMPGPAERRALLRHLVEASGLAPDPVADVVADAMPHATGSDLTRMWDLARRRAVLDGRPTSETLLELAVESASNTGAQRDRLCLALHETLRLSNREIAARLGISHPTVASCIKRARGTLD